MGSYSLFIKPSAGKELEAIRQKKVQHRIISGIRALADEPRPIGCERLSGSVALYRVRVGVYRIVYAIDDELAEVHVSKIGHRREVYR